MTPRTKVWLGASAGAILLWMLVGSKKALAANPYGGPVTDTSKQAIMDKVRAEALKQGVPPELALATAEVESGFSNVKAAKGESYGPMQVHTSSGYSAAQLQNEDFSIAAGVTILRNRLRAAKGDSLLARIMYFCGPGYEKSCSQAAIDRLKTRWAPVASKWGVRPSYPV